MAKKIERRNANPSEVSVMDVADCSGMETLDEMVEAMVENRNEIVIHNIEYILRQKNMSQARLCNDLLEGSPQPPQLAAYKQPGKDIPFRTVVRVALACGVSPEQMYGQLLDHSEGPATGSDKVKARPRDEYMKYIGTYSLAFFYTDAKLGNNKRSTARAMGSGVLTIFDKSGKKNLSSLDVLAFVNCTEAEQEELLEAVRAAERKGSARAIRDCYERLASVVIDGAPRMKCFYEGHMTLNDWIAQIHLHQVEGSDVINLEMHNRAANSSAGSEYKGGLATTQSTSRGEEKMPCVQTVAISRPGFRIAKEELANHLFMGPDEVNMDEEIRLILANAKALYANQDADNVLSHLSESDKDFMLASFIAKKFNEVIKRNLRAYHKISTEMDSAYYQAVCRDQ